MLAYTIKKNAIVKNIFIPKYYDPELHEEIMSLENTHDLLGIGELIDDGILEVHTGHEIGKMAYGTGNIPFVRTSDITNWEIKTIPKQGISEEIFFQYDKKQDVQEGDILLVRDGTYLIGTNCLITKLDLPMIYQSHILKFRIIAQEVVNPYLFFLSLNSSLVQRQIRNMQFTADIIDTLGARFKELILPIPKDNRKKAKLVREVHEAVETRVKYKAAVKQMPILIERVLDTGEVAAFDDFFSKPIESITDELVQDTTTLELGDFVTFKIKCAKIVSNIFLPKYYDPTIGDVIEKLETKCQLKSIGELKKEGVLSLATGDEIGKMAYGTGDIPFIRTSDFSNWEIKADPKQGVSEDIYKQYAVKEDVRSGDILLVRDGTYLVGTSCMVTKKDEKMLFCGGLYKIRTNNKGFLDEYLLLGLLNSYIVKRQIRTKQFTRDVIDTLGKRLDEVILPIPKDESIKKAISQRIYSVIEDRIHARELISKLAEDIIL